MDAGFIFTIQTGWILGSLVSELPNKKHNRIVNELKFGTKITRYCREVSEVLVLNSLEIFIFIVLLILFKNICQS